MSSFPKQADHVFKNCFSGPKKLPGLLRNGPQTIGMLECCFMIETLSGIVAHFKGWNGEFGGLSLFYLAKINQQKMKNKY